MALTVKAFEETPNPNALRCVVSARLSEDRESYRSPEEAASNPLAAAILDIPGVTHVMLIGRLVHGRQGGGRPLVGGPARRQAGRRERRVSARDRRLAGAIERWFSASARELPWRETGPDGRRDAYRALVSEFMLQQTQVSRVVDRFAGFVERFPTAGALAGAPEEEVLGLWSGLGYYRRARNLHACARAIVDRYGGETPADAAELRTLPGGRALHGRGDLEHGVRSSRADRGRERAPGAAARRGA